METQLSTILKIAIVMDEAETRQFLVSPAGLQSEVRRQLALEHGGNGHSRNGKVAPHPKVARGKVGPGPRGASVGKLPCPNCERIFVSSKRLATHMAKQHPGGKAS